MPPQQPINSLVDLKNASIDEWNNKTFLDKNLTVHCFRLDKIHPVISGNKWFKLKNYLDKALDQNKQGIISAGGAWSNHLSALAFACNQLQLSSVGGIRGEEPANYSPTLRDLEHWGMQLEFISRDRFGNETEVSKLLQQKYPGHLWVPIGGEGIDGIEGVKELKDLVDFSPYSHIACAVGSGTFFTGLLECSNADQLVLGICSLKEASYSAKIEQTIRTYSEKTNFRIVFDYHLGGFGKFNSFLIKYMNQLYDENRIPSDFVYTAKLFFAIEDLASKGFFPKGSRLLVVHSGGLQGNRSITVKSLVF
jgi:1-aminocyclopropane-1-carboxylate deaminase